MMKTTEKTSFQKPALFTLAAVEYWENLATVSIRRLFALRNYERDGGLARQSIRQWIAQLRDCARVRAYRGW